MTTPQVMRDLDAALAQAVSARMQAANWKIRANQAEARIHDLEQLVALHDTTTRELMRMVDSLRSERDDWRIRAEMAR